MGSLLLFLGLIALVVRGIQSIWRPEQDETAPFGEGFLIFLSLGLMTWVSLVWFLALLGLLTGINLLLAAGSALLAVMGWGWVRKCPLSSWRISVGRPTRLEFFDLIPWTAFAALVAFALWRGSFLPTLNTDALFLSLPKADVYLAEAGINLFVPPTPEWMSHASQPSTYEMLLASVMALGGDDHLTEWVATLSGTGFAIGCWVLFRQWFNDRLTAHIGFLLVLSSTVFLLHLSSDKADLTTNLACLLLIYWTAQSNRRPSTRNMGFALLSGLLLMGLKKSGWLVSPVFFLVIAYLAIQRWDSSSKTRKIVKLLGLFGMGIILLGGANQLYLFVHTGNPFGIYKTGEQAFSVSAFSLIDPFRFLALVALAPYIASIQTIRMPWNGVEWYWPEYNLFFSHFGYAFILILGTALVSILFLGPWLRRTFPKSREARSWSLLALLAFAMITTHRYPYAGGFNTVARLTLFLVPALLAIGLLPLLDRTFGHRIVPSWIRGTILGAVTVLCIVSAMQAYIHDLHAPLAYVVDLWQHPEKRRWIFVEPNRLPSRLDRMAGPEDVIATDLTDHAWLHPLWGEYLSRKVLIISWQGNHAVIPEEAKWVVADNVASGIWGRGLSIRSAGDFARAKGWGLASPRDTALFRQLQYDPHWTLILSSTSGEQCLFQRRSPE